MKEKQLTGISQHRFIKVKSCLTNLVAFFSKMPWFVDKNRETDVVYLNFSKAFNTVSHNILVSKSGH